MLANVQDIKRKGMFYGFLFFETNVLLSNLKKGAKLITPEIIQFLT